MDTEDGWSLLLGEAAEDFESDSEEEADCSDDAPLPAAVPLGPLLSGDTRQLADALKRHSFAVLRADSACVQQQLAPILQAERAAHAFFCLPDAERAACANHGARAGGGDGGLLLESTGYKQAACREQLHLIMGAFDAAPWPADEAGGERLRAALLDAAAFMRRLALLSLSAVSVELSARAALVQPDADPSVLDAFRYCRGGLNRRVAMAAHVDPGLITLKRATVQTAALEVRDASSGRWVAVEARCKEHDIIVLTCEQVAQHAPACLHRVARCDGVGGDVRRESLVFELRAPGDEEKAFDLAFANRRTDSTRLY